MLHSDQQLIDNLWFSYIQLTKENLPSDNLRLDRLSPIALAYVGDAVYELYVRSQLLVPPKKIAEYHHQVVTQVKAEAQAYYLQILEPYLTTEEKDLVRRGRNAVTKKPRRISGKVYQQASSLETLIGYLYLTDGDRLKYLFTKIKIVSDDYG